MQEKLSGIVLIVLAIAGVQATGVRKVLAEAPAAAVDQAVVGTWCFSPSARGAITLSTWTINSDGSYKRTLVGPNAKQDDVGTLTFANGSWTRQGSSGQTEAGTFKQPENDILILTNNRTTVVWIRRSDAQAEMATAAGGAAAFDPELVGAWKGVSTLQNKQSIMARTFGSDGQFREKDLSYGAPDVTGKFTAANGTWTEQIDGGGENHGVYKWIDPNVMTMRGKFGWVTTWYRSAATPQLANAPAAAPAAVPAGPAPASKRESAPEVVSGTPAPPAAAAAAPAPLPASSSQASPTPRPFPAAVPSSSGAGPADEAPIGRWTASKMGYTATYTFKSDGTSFFNVDAPAFKAAYPNGIPSQYVLRKGSPFSELDLTGTDPTHPMSVKAIFLRISRDKFKVEGDMDAPRPTAFTADADVFNLAGDAPPAVTPVPPGEEWTGPADEMPVGRFGADQNGTAMYYTFKSDGTMLLEWDDPDFKVACPFGLAFKVTLQKGSPTCEMDLESLNPTKPLSLKAIYQRLSKNQFKYQDFGNAPRPAAFASNAQVFVHVADAPAAGQNAGVTAPATPATAP